MDTAVVTSADFASVLTNIQNQVSVSTVVGVLATAAAACIGLVFMWWGVRKVTQVLMSAFREGRVSL